jgi:hypothetical protein
VVKKNSPTQHPLLARRLSSSCRHPARYPSLARRLPSSLFCVLLSILQAVEDRFYLPEVPEVPEGVLLCMLEAVEGGYCLLEVLEGRCRRDDMETWRSGDAEGCKLHNSLSIRTRQSS